MQFRLRRPSTLLTILAPVIIGLFSHCDNPFSSPSNEASVTFSIVYSKTLDFNLRIIEPYSIAGEGKWNNKYSKLLTAENGTLQHTFEGVSPGNYAGLLGNISESYHEFTISRGQRITLHYARSNTDDHCVTTRSGTYCVPQYEWSCYTTID